MTRSRVKVSAIPASSMITSVGGPIAAAESGSAPWSRDHMSLARVSVWMPVCSARTAAAAADGARPTATSRRRNETGLGVEDPRRGVQLCAGDGVDRRRVDPPQRLRFGDIVSRCGRATDPRSSTSSSNRSTSAAACSAGTSMVRTCRCDSARTCHSCQVERLASITVRIRSPCARSSVSRQSWWPQQAVRAPCAPSRRRPPRSQHGCRFAEPGGALPGQGSGLLFGVAGLQRRLLRRMQRFYRVGGRP
jgi:hypothetical protein